MRAGGRSVASCGTALPRARPVPHAAAGPGRRWRADGGVKKTALAAAASHQALAGKRQRATAADAPERLPDEPCRPVGCRLALRRLHESALVRPIRGSRSPRRVSGLRDQGRATRRSPVERQGSSDMLPSLNCLVISRGFEFSAIYERRCPPAAGAAATGRSRRRRGGLVRAAARVWAAKLDRVRNGRAPESGAAPDPTPGGGARGANPTPAIARRCADRRATARRPLGFRAGPDGPAAARALHRSGSRGPIEWSL